MILSTLAQAASSEPGFWASYNMQAVGLWVGIGLTLCIYTFLYKDNPLFKFAEHLYVGVSNGYLIWQAWYSSIKPQLVVPLGKAVGAVFRTPAEPLEPGENLWLLVPAAFSVFMLLRFHPKTAWLSRWSFAFFVGTTAGTLIPLTIQAQIFKQLQPMLGSPVARADGSILVFATVNSLIVLVGVTATLFYFLFSVEHKGPVKYAAKTGIYFAMVAFGASFGYTVMARESLLIGRIDALIEGAKNSAPEGQPNPHCATLILFVLVASAVAVLEVLAAKRAKDAMPPPPAPLAGSAP